MLFNSFEFAYFFIAVFVLHFVLPQRCRWVLLLCASYLFYAAWRPAYLILIFFSTLTSWVAVVQLGHLKSIWARRTCVTMGVVLNLGVLFTFKYLDFAIGSWNGFNTFLGIDSHLPYANLILPVGISFYTFQALSYVFDAYYGKVKPENHLGRFALYVGFFPQLVAGPIERSRDLLPQFRRPTYLAYERVRDGLMIALWGLFKKVCVADLIAPVVKNVYDAPQAFQGWILLMATVLFSIQIYCDFSGYSDMALGIARMLGYDLTQNFRQPYFSPSLRLFWQRWHISLTNWFRDYLYIPLGGNRGSHARVAFNTILVFVVSGLWHGAGWTFIFWGAIHGFWLLLERVALRLSYRIPGLPQLVRSRIGNLLGGIITYLVVLMAWVFFVAHGFEEAFYVLAHMFKPEPIRYHTLVLLGLPHINSLLLLCQIGLLITGDVLIQRQPLWAKQIWAMGWGKLLVLLGLVFAIGIFGVFDRIDFIYFQF